MPTLDSKHFNRTAADVTIKAARTAEITGWGFVVRANSELDALRIAYKYRNNAYGTKVEVNGDNWQVTVWNEDAKRMGCDCY